MTLKEHLLDFLKTYEPPVHHDEDWNPMDASGGNFDDAYNMGYNDGESALAQRIRDLLRGE